MRNEEFHKVGIEKRQGERYALLFSFSSMCLDGNKYEDGVLSFEFTPKFLKPCIRVLYVM